MYSKNRTFRIWLSSKLGKKAIFAPADSDTRKLLLSKGPYTFFLYSLICAPITSESSRGSEKTETYLSFFPDTEAHNTSSSFGAKIRPFSVQPSPSSSASVACSKSPFPLLDAFLLKKATNDMDIGKEILIRRCKLDIHVSENYDVASIFLTYDLTGYRFCDLVNRTHRSNHVKLQVLIEGPWAIFKEFAVASTSDRLLSSLMAGTVPPSFSVSCVRRCMDPLCREIISSDVNRMVLSADLLYTTPELFKPICSQIIQIEKRAFNPEKDPFLIDGDDILLIDTNI